MFYVQRLTAAAIAAAVSSWHRIERDERGEGVISSAIAVLVMALLGALMWVAFKAIFAECLGPHLDPGRADRFVTARRLRGERGSGIVSSLAGVTMFLAFLLLAVHVVVGLYAMSIVTDAAAMGARRVAGVVG